MKQDPPLPLFPIHAYCLECLLCPIPRTSLPGKLLEPLEEPDSLHSVARHSCTIVQVPHFYFICLCVCVFCHSTCSLIIYSYRVVSEQGQQSILSGESECECGGRNHEVACP